MAKGGRRSARFEVEWVTVSYRTIRRWIGLFVVVGCVASGTLLWRHLSRMGERAEIARLLDSADQSLRVLQQGGRSVDVAPAAASIGSGREALAADRLDAARRAADEARALLRALGSPDAELAQLLRVEGEVQVKRVGGLDWVDARQGLHLRPGDLLRTGSNAAAQVNNLDGSTHTLRANTMMRIERSAKDSVSGRTDVAVEVTAGRLTIVSDQQAPGSTSEVKTPNISAHVESNTVLGVGFDLATERSELDVIEGRARLRIGDTTMDLGGSQGVTVSPEGVERRQLPSVPRLTAPPMHKLLLVSDLAQEGLELEWESARDARAYRVELSQSPLFTNVLREWTAHPATFVEVELPPVGHYYWRVAALDREGAESGWSPPSGFRISDAVPVGEPPPLKITGYQALGEGVFLFEGRTRVGVSLSIDDGSRVTYFQPQQSGAFRQILAIPYEGSQVVTITARDSQGLERAERVRVEVQLP